MYRASGASAPEEDATGEEPESGEETVPDQAKRSARKPASKRASASRRDSASMTASKAASRKGGQRKVTPTALDEAPPPPGRQREARVQFNHRILMDRHEVLESYKTEHGATWQGIVDQMVDEYLARRGLLPDADADE